MKQWILGLLDEQNRKADLAAFGQLVALAVSVLFSGGVLAASTYYTFKTGKIDSNALWLIGFWIGCAFGYGSVDKFKLGGQPTPAAPTAPAAITPPVKPATPATPPAPTKTEIKTS